MEDGETSGAMGMELNDTVGLHDGWMTATEGDARRQHLKSAAVAGRGGACGGGASVMVTAMWDSRRCVYEGVVVTLVEWRRRGCWFWRICVKHVEERKKIGLFWFCGATSACRGGEGCVRGTILYKYK